MSVDDGSANPALRYACGEGRPNASLALLTEAERSLRGLGVDEAEVGDGSGETNDCARERVRATVGSPANDSGGILLVEAVCRCRG